MIPFKDLVKLIEQDKQPDKIRVWNNVYEWSVYDYIDTKDNKTILSHNYSLIALIRLPIEILDSERSRSTRKEK